MAAATSSTVKDINAQRVARVRIDGDLFDRRRLEAPAQATAFQLAMGRAREKFGHALCDCQRPPLKLQIRLRDARYHLAVWPDEGHLHATNCVFFRDDEVAPVHVTASPGTVLGERAARHKVQFAHSLHRGLETPRPAASEAEPSSPMSLEDLCNMLWQRASLCDWHPSWTRDWGRTRYQLLRAADEVEIEGQPLAERIFVPRPYRDNHREELNREWDSFVTKLSRTTEGVIRSAFIVAPIRRLVDLPTGGMSLRLRHLRSPIGMSDAVYEHLMRSCRAALRRIDANDEARELAQSRPKDWVELSQPEVVGVLLVEPNSRQGLWCKAAWLMQVHPRYFLPTNNHDEVLLADTLVKNRYQFTRHVSSIRSSARVHPDWTLRHAVDPDGRAVPRVALEIMSNGAGQEYRASRSVLVDALARRGIPTWTWVPTGAQITHHVPPLPAHGAAGEDEIARALTSMSRDRNLHYAYGSGRASLDPERKTT